MLFHLLNEVVDVQDQDHLALRETILEELVL